MGACGGPGVRWLGVAVAAFAVVSLGVGFAWKDQCNHRPWDGPNPPEDWDWQYRAYCYSDILPLWFHDTQVHDGRTVEAHDLQHVKIPYVENFNEYPVLTAFFMYGVAFVTSGSVPDADGGSHLESSLLPYMEVTFVLLTLLGAVATYALWKLRMQPERILAWVLAPTMIIHGLTNWDLLAVALAACGWWAWRQDRPFTAALLLGLGGAAKLYPAFFLPFLLLAAWRSGGRKQAAPVFWGATVGFALLNLLVAALAWDNWIGMWSFQAHRPPDFETPWASALQPFFHWVSPFFDSPDGWTAWPGYIGLAAMLGCVALLGRMVLRKGLDPLVAGGLTTLVFLLVNKVYSPQYTLWALPILLLLEAGWVPLLLFIAADTANFLVRYQYIGNHGWHEEWAPWSHLMVDLRWLALFWATWSILRRNGLVPDLLGRLKARKSPAPAAPAATSR